MSETIEQLANQFPDEVTEAVEAFDGQREQAIMVLLFNEGSLSFTELREKLSEEERYDKGKLTYSLNKLADGGLIQKRLLEREESDFSSYYDISEYGERFIDSLFYTLGSTEGPSAPEKPAFSEGYMEVDLYDSTGAVSKEMGRVLEEAK